MLIFTNRAYDPSREPLERFTCHFNAQTPGAFVAARVDGASAEIVADAVTPAQQADLFVRECLASESPTLLYMHGFNNTVADVFARSRAFATYYGVNVVAITWPSEGAAGPDGISQAEVTDSDPEAANSLVASVRRSKGIADRYGQARKNARVTALALEGFLAEVTRAWNEKGGGAQSPTLAVHSLGNYVLQNALESPQSSVDVDAFANVVLLAPDADGVGHAAWLKQAGKQPEPGAGIARVIVTVNRNDWVLAAANIFNKKQRLGTYGFGGQHLTNESYNAIYLDCTVASKQAAGHSYFVDADSLGSDPKPTRLRRVMQLALSGKPLPTVNSVQNKKKYYGSGVYASPPIADVEIVPVSSEPSLGDWP